jgi:hypothetical protein
MKVAMIILWPAFLAAGIAEVLLFTVLDPSEFGVSRMAAYSAGFLFFWVLAAASSGLTCFLQRDAEDINQRRG